MPKRIVFLHSSGSVVIMDIPLANRRAVVITPATFDKTLLPETEFAAARFEMNVIPAIVRDETDDEVYLRVAKRCVPAGVEFHAVEEEAIPAVDHNDPTAFDAALAVWFDTLETISGIGVGIEQWDADEAVSIAARKTELENAASLFAADIDADNAAMAIDFAARARAALADLLARIQAEADAAAAAETNTAVNDGGSNEEGGDGEPNDDEETEEGEN